MDATANRSVRIAMVLDRRSISNCRLGFSKVLLVRCCVVSLVRVSIVHR